MSDRLAVMRHGRIVQEGEPRELYEAPTDRYVADFIGVSNFLPGHVLAPAEPPAAGATGDQMLAVRLADDTVLHARAGRPGLAGGESVVVIVRPERVRMGAPADGGIQGHLVEATYLGDTIEWRVETPALGRIVVRRQNGDPTAGERYAVGDLVSVAWDDSAALALPA